MLDAKYGRLIQVLVTIFTKKWQKLGNIRKVAVDLENLHEISAISSEKRTRDGENAGGL